MDISCTFYFKGYPLQPDPTVFFLPRSLGMSPAHPFRAGHVSSTRTGYPGGGNGGPPRHPGGGGPPSHPGGGGSPGHPGGGGLSGHPGDGTLS